MLTTVPFGEWLPDLSGNVVRRAENVRAIANGYAPVKAFQAITTPIPLNGTATKFYGGGAFIDSTGTSHFIACSDQQVLEWNGSDWGEDSLHNSVAASPFRIAQFGDYLMIADGASFVYTSMTAEDYGSPTDGPATAIDVAQVRDFVMCLTTDNKVQWSQFNNAKVWTTGENQADYQPILSSQGVRLIGGEYGILIKKQGITRITYVGAAGGIVFQFDEISAEVGCMAAGSVCNVGRLIFFLSERGFMMCDGAEVTPLGDEKFNRWFFSRFSRTDMENIWSAIDPRNSLVLWAMPGTPGTIIAYNWVLRRATTFSVNVTGLFTGYTAGASLEGLDEIYGDLDSMDISLDDSSIAGGNPVLLVVNDEIVVGALNGANLEATIQIDHVEPSPGRRSRIRSLRLASDATSASATVDARMRLGDAEANRSTSTMRDNGKLPIRSNGRYNTLSVTIPAEETWSFIQGAEVEFEPGDGR